jgi:hypothetical protein
MGQYYIPSNIDKNEFLRSYDFDNGAKLMESAWIGNRLIGNVMVRLADETIIKASKKIASIPFAGTWANDRIVWAGDYMDEDTLFPDNFEELGGDKCFLDDEGDSVSRTLYSLAYNSFNQLKEDDDKIFTIFSLKNVYFLNHDLKQYIVMPKENIDEYIINPVSLLLASGNGRGGGDYRGSNDEMVGAWAGNSVSISRKIPKDYALITPDFAE